MDSEVVRSCWQCDNKCFHLRSFFILFLYFSSPFFSLSPLLPSPLPLSLFFPADGLKGNINEARSGLSVETIEKPERERKRKQIEGKHQENNI